MFYFYNVLIHACNKSVKKECPLYYKVSPTIPWPRAYVDNNKYCMMKVISYKSFAT